MSNLCQLFDELPNTVSCNDCIIHFADIYTVGSESKEKELEDSQPFIHGVKLLLKQNIVRCYSDLKPNVPTRNCIGSLCSQDLWKLYHTNCGLVMHSSKSY